MKASNWFFLILVVALCACKSSSQEELVGNWVKRGDFGGPPRSHATAFVMGEKGYVCLGYTTGKDRRKDVYEYDNTTRNWRPMNDFQGKARQEAVGFVIGSKAYVGTGWDGDEDIMNDFWEFDPAGDGGKGSWREVAPFPGVARRAAVAFTLKVGGKEYGYVGTGNTEGNDKLSLKDFWRYDAETDTWESAPEYDGAKRYGAVTFVIDNKAYLVTGANSGSGTSVVDMWMFDPEAGTTGTWRQKRKITNSNPDEDYDDDYNDIVRYNAVAFTVKVSGELRGHVTVGTSKSTTWEYDPKTDLWDQRTTHYSKNISQPKEGAIAFSFLESDQAFVGLGRSGTSPYDDMRQFIPLVDDDTYDDQ